MLAQPKPTGRRRKVRADKSMLTFAKAPPPDRDEDYRRLVASLECFNCKRQGHSQAAHPNSGKAKGQKLGDDRVFPLCTIGGADCHGKFDRYELMPKGPAMIAFEAEAWRWTVRVLLGRGLWPMDRPVPDIRRVT